MSFVMKDDNVLDKYSKIWNKLIEELNIKFHNMPVYDEKYIKAKVREFNGVIKTDFLGDEIPKESLHYNCIACITIDSVMRMGKKELFTTLFRRMEIQIKKIKITKFINTELESESQSQNLTLNQSQNQSQNLTLTSCSIFTQSDFALSQRWLLNDFEQVKILVVIFMTLNKSKSPFGESP